MFAALTGHLRAADRSVPSKVGNPEVEDVAFAEDVAFSGHRNADVLASVKPSNLVLRGICS